MLKRLELEPLLCFARVAWAELALCYFTEEYMAFALGDARPRQALHGREVLIHVETALFSVVVVILLRS